eukprot:Lithocolla_globosa_v1_NODE_1615_length_2446_cov_108.467169.p1 type:complete len:653 gc:universal NODE_1615_length_2446_cov_108.467169:1985-27(-)
MSMLDLTVDMTALHGGSKENLHDPIQRIQLSWHEIEVEVPLKHNRTRKILRNCYGTARPGEVLAIMGASGGGKTTLLNVISGRKKQTSGDILLNGLQKRKYLKELSAYVMQDDHLFSTLTPKELLSFSATLRLPKSLTKEAREQRVESILQKLRLEKCANTLVGSPFIRGLSGGERKRCSVGYELITNPSILYLDEPTSGLDSQTAVYLVDTLKELAQDGRTIITTIHQPSSQLFAQFDSLYLLRSGHNIFFGSIPESLDHFKELGYSCPPHLNPADYFMFLMSDQESGEKLIQHCKKFEKPSPLILTQEIHEPDDQDQVSLFIEFSQLFLRNLRLITRNPIIFRARIGQNVFIGLLSGLIFFQVGQNYNQISVQDRMGALFCSALVQILTAQISVVLTFPAERILLLREQNNNMYGVLTYYLSKDLSQLPFDILYSSLFSVIIYFLAGFKLETSAFFFFLLTMLLANLAGASTGLLTGVIAPTPEAAVALTPVLLLPFILLGGFFVATESLPVWIAWIGYISPFKWAHQALVTNEFKELEFICDADEYLSFNPNEFFDFSSLLPDFPPQCLDQMCLSDNGFDLSSLNQSATVAPLEICPISTGEQVLDNLDFRVEDQWKPLWVLALVIISFKTIGAIVLKYTTIRDVKNVN